MRELEPSVTDLLGELLADATATMMRLSGGRAVCAFTRAGQAVPGIKYAEGRWASLRELERQVRRGLPPAEALAAGLDRWRTQQAAAGLREVGPDWVAYHAGAVDALQEFEERLAGRVAC